MRGLRSGGGEVCLVPWWLAAFPGDGIELGDFGGREEETSGCVRGGCGAGFRLAWQGAAFVAVAEDIGEHGFEVFLLRASAGKESASERVGMNH